ncbi:MAG: hypothetical protein AAGK38_04670 [Pseudomonadota bacterium]
MHDGSGHTKLRTPLRQFGELVVATGPISPGQPTSYGKTGPNPVNYPHRLFRAVGHRRGRYSAPG